MNHRDRSVLILGIIIGFLAAELGEKVVMPLARSVASHMTTTDGGSEETLRSRVYNPSR
jgi:hypothetical protein